MTAGAALFIAYRSVPTEHAAYAVMSTAILLVGICFLFEVRWGRRHAVKENCYECSYPEQGEWRVPMAALMLSTPFLHFENKEKLWWLVALSVGLQVVATLRLGRRVGKEGCRERARRAPRRRLMRQVRHFSA